MKKTLFISAGIIIVLFLIFFFGSGFLKNTSTFIGEYEISEDGRQINFNIGVGSSVGFVRKAKVHQQEGGKLYIDFISAFGGFNGSIGAKWTYKLELDEDTEIIAVYRGNGSYQEVLHKNEDGEWQRN